MNDGLTAQQEQRTGLNTVYCCIYQLLRVLVTDYIFAVAAVLHWELLLIIREMGLCLLVICCCPQNENQG